MPVFAVEAIDRAGKRVRKEMDAVSKDEAIKKVRSQGLRPTKIAEKKAAPKTPRPTASGFFNRFSFSAPSTAATSDPLDRSRTGHHR